jgi:hypothetical protein
MDNAEKLGTLWSTMADLSGFPEPFLSGSRTYYQRWSNIYSQQLIREDIRDAADIKSINEVETLYYLLPSRTGSPLSVVSLSEDLKVSYNSVRKWLSIFETFLLTFSITPWTSKIARAIQKERKVYLWDAPRIKDPAARFENMVALELWRAVTAWNDIGYGTFSLHFIKNREKQEVDFLIARDREPFLMVETKLSRSPPSPVLMKFQKKLKVPAIQLTQTGDTYRKFTSEGQPVVVAPACIWLAGLP